ncbi:MAG TPA: hypothetical protein VN258_16360 [Mobilitalea sp.]|nr:hypothetical protein [Mobilitalea sp.]
MDGNKNRACINSDTSPAFSGILLYVQNTIVYILSITERLATFGVDRIININLFNGS